MPRLVIFLFMSQNSSHLFNLINNPILIFFQACFEGFFPALSRYETLSFSPSAIVEHRAFFHWFRTFCARHPLWNSVPLIAINKTACQELTFVSFSVCLQNLHNVNVVEMCNVHRNDYSLPFCYFLASSFA